LVKTGLELIEIAPGIDLERDILGQMAFRPLVAPTLKTMDPGIFHDQPMGMRNAMLAERRT
jgi:propionate CoA-transferase